jgi:hypothetical protein
LNDANTPCLFLKKIPIIRSHDLFEENLLPDSTTPTRQQHISINCPGLGARPKLDQQSDIVVGNYGREGNKRYGLGQGSVPRDESQRGRVNELDLNGLITVFHSKRVKDIWSNLFPTARWVFPSQFILPIPEHLMAIDTSALICLLITIQMMRDVKTTGRVQDGTWAGPELSDPPVHHIREVRDPEVRSLLGEKRLMGPFRNLDPSQSAPYLENIGVCMKAKTTGFSAGSYTAIVLHRALTFLGVFMRITPITEAGAIAVPPYYLYMMTRFLSLTHYERDKLCIWGLSPLEKEMIARIGIRLSYIVQDNKRAAELLGGSNHRYSELVSLAQKVRQMDGS